MPNPNDTGNMLRDLLEQGVPVEALQLPNGQIDRVADDSDEHGAAVAERMRSVIKSLSRDRGEVIVIDSPAQLASREARLLEPVRGSLDGFVILPPGPEIKKLKPMPKPKEKTQADVDALAAAEAKRQRKAAKLRGNK